MEEGGGQEGDGDRDRRIRVRRHAGAALGRQGLGLAGEHHVEEVGHAAPVGQLGALREAGRAGGVEDAGVIVRIDLGVRHGAARGDDLGPGGIAFGRGRADGDQGHAFDHFRPLGDARHALRIDEGHLGLGVLEAVGHFLGGPPGVHPDDGDADGDAGPVDQHPLREVAHGNGDAVAALNASGQKPVGDAGHPLVRLGVGDALVLVDDVGPVGEGGGGEPDRPHVRRRILVDLHGGPADLLDYEFKGGARRGQFVPGLLQFGIVQLVSPPRGRGAITAFVPSATHMAPRSRKGNRPSGVELHSPANRVERCMWSLRMGSGVMRGRHPGSAGAPFRDVRRSALKAPRSPGH